MAEPLNGNGDLGPRSAAWRLVEILKALASSPEGLGVRDTARAIGVDKSSISRMLSHLQSLGMVVQEQVTGKYAVGPELYAIAASLVARDSLAHAAQPILDALTRRFNEASYLAVLRDVDFVYRAKADCTQQIRYVIDIGYVGPLHAGAAGRAILAGLTEAELRDTLSRIDLPRLTDITITDREELMKQVAFDRARGYSFTMGERFAGGAATAAPFFDGHGRCRGAVVLSLPASRFTEENQPAQVAAVMDAARQMTLRIGGTTRA